MLKGDGTSFLLFIINFDIKIIIEYNEMHNYKLSILRASNKSHPIVSEKLSQVIKDSEKYLNS